MSVDKNELKFYFSLSDNKLKTKFVASQLRKIKRSIEVVAARWHLQGALWLTKRYLSNLISVFLNWISSHLIK